MSADNTIADALAATDLFGSLDKRTLKRIAGSVTPVRHPAGKTITTQGRDGIGFHLILSGSAVVSINGEEVGRLKAGDYFGEISLIDGKERTATVMADSDIEGVALSSWQFRPLLDEVPGLAKALLLVMCDRVRKAHARAVVLTP